MKLQGNATMTITVQYPPEVRFTPNGKRVCVFYAAGLREMRFEAWEGSIGDLPDLGMGDAITVTGEAKYRDYKVEGEIKRYPVFVIHSWKKAQ